MLWFTLWQAVALVILVVFIFLQNARSTLIPTLTVPVSLIGTFMVFPLLGFSINTLSLLGLVLAIGIVVDDAIVVVEAVALKMEQGMSPKEATIEAMRERSGGFGTVLLLGHNCANPEATLRSYELIARNVIPAINGMNRNRKRSLDWASENHGTFIPAMMGGITNAIAEHEKETADKGGTVWTPGQPTEGS